MKTITTTDFNEVKTGNSLVFFFRAKGCPNCDKTKPVIGKLEKPNLNVYSIDADASKELVGEYAPATNWSLPLIVYMENGKVITTLTGAKTQAEILDATKTLENISDIELQGIYIEMDLKRAEARKTAFDIDISLGNITAEIQRREHREQILRTQDPQAKLATQDNTPAVA